MKGRMTPLFLGGSLSSFSTCAPGTQGEGCFKADNHSGMSQIEESGFAAFSRFSHAVPPPLRVWQTFSGTVHKKSADSASLSADLILIRKAHGPPCPTLVNRDSFPDVGFGQVHEIHAPAHGWPATAVALEKRPIV